jgi:hypothetical protein
VAAVTESYVAYELFLSRFIFSYDYYTIPNFSDLCESRFDLSQFDSIAADLHLMIKATQELDTTIRKIARPISGPI